MKLLANHAAHTSIAINSGYLELGSAVGSASDQLICGGDVRQQQQQPEVRQGMN